MNRVKVGHVSTDQEKLQKEDFFFKNLEMVCVSVTRTDKDLLCTGIPILPPSIAIVGGTKPSISCLQQTEKIAS